MDETSPAESAIDRVPPAQTLALAEQRRQAGQLLSAEDLCQQVLRQHPEHAEALHMLGIIAHGVGNSAAGIALIKRAIAADGRVPLYQSNLAEICRLNGRLEEAVAAGRRAVELQPDYAQAWNNLGIVHYDRAEFAQAEQCYRHAVRLDPRLAQAHSNLGNALRVQGKLGDAVETYTRAIQLEPSAISGYQNLGTVLRDQGRFAEAEATYRKGLALRPHDPTLLNHLALAVLDQKRDAEASALLGLGRLEEAKDAYEQAVALLPSDPDVIRLGNRLERRIKRALEQKEA
jgi:tetratricopeptide (TPR) repeat protein